MTYTDAALQACVTLTERYMFERSLPDKAIDALDEAGSRMHLLKVQLPEPIVAQEKTVEALRQSKETAAAEQRYEEAAELRDQLRLAEAEVERLKAEWQSNLKEHRITVDEADISKCCFAHEWCPCGTHARRRNDSPQRHATSTC